MLTAEVYEAEHRNVLSRVASPTHVLTFRDGLCAGVRQCTGVSRAKTDETIEMPFGVQTSVEPCIRWKLGCLDGNWST